MADLISTFTGLWNSVVTLVPNIFAAVVLLVVGYALGKILGAAVESAIRKARLEKYIDLRVKGGFSALFGTLTSWGIYLTFLQLGTAALGIEMISSIWGGVMGSLPGLIKAAAIILSGYVVGLYIENQILSVRAAHSDLIGRLTFIFVVYLSLALGLSSAGLEAELVRNTLLILVGSLGLGFAFAIGSGRKERVIDLVRKFVK